MYTMTVIHVERHASQLRAATPAEPTPTPKVISTVDRPESPRAMSTNNKKRMMRMQAIVWKSNGHNRNQHNDHNNRFE